MELVMQEQEKRKENPLGTLPVHSLLMKFTVPSIVAMLTSALYNIVDQYFIGNSVGERGNGAGNCPIIVASAAPAIPISNPKTKRASKMVLITAPTILQTIEKLGLPSARIKCPPPLANISIGNPMEVMLT